ncbi:clotting factor B [Trichonephila clavipes]|nr:clotting factor B [Trichonephila clavipes]
MLPSATIMKQPTGIEKAFCDEKSSTEGADKISIKAGSNIISSNSDQTTFSADEFIDVLNVRIHEHYIPKVYYNDIAILRLARTASFIEHVSPICLPSTQDLKELTTLTNVTLTGWGHTSYGGRDSVVGDKRATCPRILSFTISGGITSKVLQEVVLQVIPLNRCQISYGDFRTESLHQGITTDMLCAGKPEGESDACQQLEKRMEFSNVCRHPLLAIRRKRPASSQRDRNLSLLLLTSAPKKQNSFWRRRDGEKFNSDCVVRTVKHPTKIMIWSVFSGKGTGRLDVVKARSIKAFLAEQNIPLLDWPGDSPDMNPIENIWELMKREVAKDVITNKTQLLERIIHVCNHPPQMQETVQSSTDSMPRRIEALIAAKGGSTKY